MVSHSEWSLGRCLPSRPSIVFLLLSSLLSLLLEGSSADTRATAPLPLPENKDTLCRNILIYGHCRYEDKGCLFNHDQSKLAASQSDQ